MRLTSEEFRCAIDDLLDCASDGDYVLIDFVWVSVAYRRLGGLKIVRRESTDDEAILDLIDFLRQAVEEGMKVVHAQKDSYTLEELIAEIREVFSKGGVDLLLKSLGHVLYLPLRTMTIDLLKTEQEDNKNNRGRTTVSCDAFNTSGAKNCASHQNSFRSSPHFCAAMRTFSR